MHGRALAAHQLEIGRDVPTHHVDKFAGALDCLRDRRKGLCTIDEDVEPAAPARRRFAGRPDPIAVGFQRALPGEATKAVSVLAPDRSLDAVTDRRIQLGDEERAVLHAAAAVGRRAASQAARPPTRSATRDPLRCRRLAPITER